MEITNRSKRFKTFLLSDVDDNLAVKGTNIGIKVSDNKSFGNFIQDYVTRTNQHVLTFYCQGGVVGNPAGSDSCRGLFISSASEDDFGYGVYYAISNGGRLYTGTVTNSSWNESQKYPIMKELWTGTHNFKDTNKKEQMTDSIDNYNYVEIYTDTEHYRTQKVRIKQEHFATSFMSMVTVFMYAQALMYRETLIE